MHKSAVRRVVFWAALVVAAGCLGFAAWYHYSNYKTAQNYDELLSEVSGGIETADAGEAETERVYTLAEIEAAEFTGEREGDAPVIPADVLTDAEEHPVDFEILQSYNPELYAWIRIPDTNIDYPVAQYAGTDQTFYLHHDLYGNAQFAGCIYSERPAAKDFSDPVTVLYGHNMKNGSMFQNLHLFRDEDFFQEHPYVYIYTPEETLIYRIYACYAYDDRRITEAFDFTKEEELTRYLESTTQPRAMEACVREDIKVSPQDHVLTLSTCIYGETGARLLLQAVLSYES